MAKTDPDAPRHRQFSTFLVELPDPGYRIVRDIPVLTDRLHPRFDDEVTIGHAEVAIENLVVPHENILGGLGEGFAMGQHRLGYGRLRHGMWSVAKAQVALDMATKRAIERETFGERVADRQGIQWMLADCAEQLYITKLLILHIAYKMERGLDLRQENSIAKNYIAHMLHNVDRHRAADPRLARLHPRHPARRLVRRGAPAAPGRRPRRGAPLDDRAQRGQGVRARRHHRRRRRWGPVLMDLADRCAVVTGGGHGIGRALAERLAREGAKVVVADLHGPRAEKVARNVGGLAVTCDVGQPEAVHDLVQRATTEFGPVRVFCSNAGINDIGPDLGSTPEQVRTVVDVNLLAHVWAAQEVVPQMVDQGEGYLVQTLSSAALITGPSNMAYTMTKHGGLGFAEWLALNYAHRGIRVCCICPNAVNTGMLGRNEDDEAQSVRRPDDPVIANIGDIVEPELCADMALEAMADGRFLVLPIRGSASRSPARRATTTAGWRAPTAACGGCAARPDHVERIRASFTQRAAWRPGR